MLFAPIVETIGQMKIDRDRKSLSPVPVAEKGAVAALPSATRSPLSHQSHGDRWITFQQECGEMNDHVELARLRTDVNCAVLLERSALPWRLDPQQSTQKCLKYRRGAGEILLITHDGRGWWDPGSAAKGDVFALVQYLEPDLNFGQVRKALRPFAGLTPSFPVATRAHERKAPLLPVVDRWQSRRAPARGSPCWKYLTEERGLPASVIDAAIRANVLQEGPYGSAWFAHRQHDGTLSGIEMRGPTFRGFSPGGEKSLFRLPIAGGTIRRVVVTEAPIDALSLAAIEKQPTGTLYVSTAGGMGPGTIAALVMQLMELASVPDAVLIAATDADHAGDKYAQQLMAMAQEADVRSERMVPQNGEKDWNDNLRIGKSS
jgi:hypothetical protein